MRRVYYGKNWDGISPWKPRNDKVILARNFAHKLEGNAYLGAEVRAQWSMLNKQYQLEK